MNSDSAAQRSLAAAVRQFLNQVGRLLEEAQPGALLADNGPVMAALVSWRQAVEAQTSGLSTEKARALEIDKLRLMGEVGALKKETADLRERNEQLRAEVVRLNQREQEFKQQLLDAEFRGGGARAQAKTLDLEIRDLRRRIRELEGGPPLKPSEAAPQSLDKLEALFAGKAKEAPVADSLQVSDDNVGSAARQDPPEAAPKKRIRRAPARKATKKVAQKAGKKKAASKKAPTKKAPKKKAAARKSPAKKAPAKKAPAKKAPAKTAPVKKAPAKKSPPKKKSAQKQKKKSAE